MPASVKAPGGAKRGDEAAQGLALEPKPVHQGEHFLLAKVGNEPRALVQLKPEVTGAKTGKRFRGSEAGMRPLPFSSVPSSAVEALARPGCRAAPRAVPSRKAGSSPFRCGASAVPRPAPPSKRATRRPPRRGPPGSVAAHDLVHLVTATDGPFPSWAETRCRSSPCARRSRSSGRQRARGRRLSSRRRSGSPSPSSGRQRRARPEGLRHDRADLRAWIAPRSGRRRGEESRGERSALVC